MIDLVARLREHWHGSHDQLDSPCMVCHKAASEIERLRAHVAELERDAGRLEWVLPIVTGTDNDETDARTMALGRALMGGLDGRAAIDKAREGA